MNKDAYPYIFVLIILAMIAGLWYFRAKLKIFDFLSPTNV